MEPKQSSDNRFALLIDADNVSARYVKPILDKLSKYGDVAIKRIYGDWTLSLHNKWKKVLLDNSITPIQQFGYTQGKNSTDSAMIIDAMDILYGDSVDGFCIVSSDSDFTRLASRLRESGRMVIGMGEKKTPVPFRRACDVFTALELLANNGRQPQGDSRHDGAGTPAMSKREVEKAVISIITDNTNRGKSTGLGEIGSRILKRYPDFDVRNYGTSLLSKLLEEFPSVNIIKDRSNVTVELTDAAADVPDADSGEGLGEAAGEGSSEGDAPSPAEHGGEGAPDQGNGSSSRRRRGGRRRRGSRGQSGAQAQPQTPQDYIRQLVRDSGAEGITLSQIGDAVRKAFKDFKVRDLGFPQMRQYVASIDDFTIEKVGRDSIVRLAD